MKINTILILFILSAAFIGCNSSTKTASEQADTTEPAKMANDTISVMYEHYLALKDALVKSDTASASTAANHLAAALSKVRGCETTSEIAKELSSSNDIEIQRAKFLKLSEDIIPVMKSTKLLSGSIFVAFCPMADNGNGAYWLSSRKEIENPYYGNTMLDCGEVKEEIKTN
jgi:hypothetical protein